MTYKQIIESNCAACSPHWWPKYAYHFSDAANIVSILSSGLLFSRAQATQRGVMENDNASKQVIDMTDIRTTSFVRFYFRPLTPTQYYNEGFKHAKLRYDGDPNANVPVPVFLVFDLEALLRTPNVCFSPQGQAGTRRYEFQGEEAFEKLPFDKIYSNGPCDDDTRRYRHAELSCPDLYAIGSSLRMILCRNECEQATLLNLLYDENRAACFQYRSLVRIARRDVFQRNGLYVEHVNFNDNTLAFEFARTYEKKKYDESLKRRYALDRLEPVRASYRLQWTDRTGSVLYSAALDRPLDYEQPQPVLLKLPPITGASSLKATLLLDGKTVCVTRHAMDSFELL